MVKKESLTVISNTGPLISLILIDKLLLLEKMFGGLLISNQVYKEIVNLEQKGYLKKEVNKKWIKKLKSPKLDVLHRLHEGEASSISLALQYDKSLFLTDDFEARNFASYIGLEVMGTAGVLLLAKKEKLISNVGVLINTLVDNKRWLSKELIIEILKRANEL